MTSSRVSPAAKSLSISWGFWENFLWLKPVGNLGSATDLCTFFFGEDWKSVLVLKLVRYSVTTIKFTCEFPLMDLIRSVQNPH